jgi:hypothetical protein
MTSFLMKAKFLSELCRTAKSGAEIEMVRILLFQQLAAVKSTKRWFYFLRFFRLRLIVGESKVEVYRQNTAEWMTDIFAVFTPQSDAVVNELCRLVQSVFSVEVLRQKAEQYPHLASILFRSFQEGDYYAKVPALVLEVVAHHAQHLRHEVTKLLEDRRDLILSNSGVAREVMNFLSRDPTILAKTDLYLSALFGASSPIFVVGAQLAIQLIAHCSTSLCSSESAIPHIRINGYSLVQTMSVSSAYY